MFCSFWPQRDLCWKISSISHLMNYKKSDGAASTQWRLWWYKRQTLDPSQSTKAAYLLGLRRGFSVFSVALLTEIIFVWVFFWHESRNVVVLSTYEFKCLPSYKQLENKSVLSQFLVRRLMDSSTRWQDWTLVAVKQESATQKLDSGMLCPHWDWLVTSSFQRKSSLWIATIKFSE